MQAGTVSGAGRKSVLIELSGGAGLHEPCEMTDLVPNG